MVAFKFWAVLVLVALVAEGGAEDTSSCLNQLAPCLNYLKGNGDVADSCCDPLKSVIKSNPECLCSMISNKGSSEAVQAGINVTEAQQLPARCGQHVNPLACITGSPTSDNTSHHQSCATIISSSSTFLLLCLILWMAKGNNFLA